MRNALDCQNVNSILQICSAKWRLNKHEKFLAGAVAPCEMEPVTSCGAALC